MTKEELETLYMDIYDNGLVSNEYKEKFKRYINNCIAESEKKLAISEHDREHNDYELAEVYKKVEQLKEENKELKKKIEKHKWNDIFLEDCATYDKKIAEEYTTLQERIEELEKENAELKTIKIPQLERRIASIRGCHSVDVKKLNARIEQVERLKKENTEVREELNEAKDLIRNLLRVTYGEGWNYSLQVKVTAEKFLKESEQ